MFENGFPTRRAILALIVLIALVWGLVWLLRSSSDGYLTVTANSDTAIVSVRPINDYQGGDHTTSGTGSVTARVKPGQYVIAASDHAFTTSKVVTVKAKQKSSYSLRLAKASALESVMSTTTPSLAVSDSKLIYEDPVTKNLMILDSSNKPRLMSDVFVNQAGLVSTSLGVVQAENGNLYRISGDSLAPLNTGGHAVNSGLSNVSLSDSGWLAFVSGHEVFAGKLGSVYKPVYHVEDHSAKVFSGNGKVLVVEESESGGDAEGNDKVAVVDANGKATVKEIGVLQAEWSPSGKYIFVGAEDGNSMYDSSLKRVSTLDATPFASTSWVNDNLLAYATGNHVWLYNVSNKQSGQIATSQNDIGLVYVTPDGSYVYVASQGSGGGTAKGGISRVGLKGQSIPSYLQTLNVFLPEDVGECSLDYINFTKPAITIKYPDSGTDPSLCVKSAKGELNYYNVDTSKFDFVTTPYTVHY